MFLCPWDSPGKNTGVGCHTLQRILPGIKPVSPVSCFGRWVLYHLESPVNRSGNLVLNNKPAPNVAENNNQSLFLGKNSSFSCF